MAHIGHGRGKLLARVRRIKGQVAALEAALSADAADCAASLQQIAAIRGAVGGLMTQVLDDHIREHLGTAQATPKQRAAEVEQVLAALRSYLR